jgi:hypothetical protein
MKEARLALPSLTAWEMTALTTTTRRKVFINMLIPLPSYSVSTSAMLQRSITTMRRKQSWTTKKQISFWIMCKSRVSHRLFLAKTKSLISNHIMLRVIAWLPSSSQEGSNTWRDFPFRSQTWMECATISNRVNSCKMIEVSVNRTSD